ncbi:unnamed protein product, partial [marine sediment metagenome]
GFTPSTIFKPLLQMLGHFAAHPTDSIRYVLFAHFPGAETAQPSVGKNECNSALTSIDRALKKYVDAVPSTVDIDGFLNNFTMDFGPCYDDLVAQVSKALEDNGIPVGEIETLAYPNVINIIAGISILHDPAKRQITRKQFIDQLNGINILFQCPVYGGQCGITLVLPNGRLCGLCTWKVGKEHISDTVSWMGSKMA